MPRLLLLLALLLAPSACASSLQPPASGLSAPATRPLLAPNDRLAIYGSSSTKIGVWPDTLQFLLRTRHPELRLAFSRQGVGGGSFLTALRNLDEWLAADKPTIVLYNFGTNDAGAGEKGIATFLDRIDQIAARTTAAGARVVLVAPQPLDPAHRSATRPAVQATRALYAKAMADHAAAKGIAYLDIRTPLAALLEGARRDDAKFTIMVDHVHLNEAAYVAWGLHAYAALRLPPAESSLTIDAAAGKALAATRCKADAIAVTPGGITFDRRDEILPVLRPKNSPRAHAPFELHSRYLLSVKNLPPGDYLVIVDNITLATLSADRLAAGVNLNTLAIDAAVTPPWQALAAEIYAGKSLDQIGKTRFRFEIRKR